MEILSSSKKEKPILNPLVLDQHKLFITWIYKLKSEQEKSVEFDNHLKYCTECVKNCGADFLFDLD